MTLSVELHCHPASPCDALERIEVEVARVANGLRLIYRVDGEIDALRIPQPQSAARRDELWRHTCCEVFIATPAHAGYREFNFSPSSEWAAYGFTGYRQDMQPLALEAAPIIALQVSSQQLALHANVDLPATDEFTAAEWRLGLSVVVEQHDGQRSYWALNHPGIQPDFHHRDAFVLAI